jgi:MFS family permease
MGDACANNETRGPRRNIYALGLVSFFTDVSSEMAYPLLPDLLKSVGGGAVWLGVIEGVAEATASLMKAVSGYFSDRLGKRKPLVFGGYFLSGVAKPLLGIAGSWPLILFVRFFDRMGKGIRTAPRDALIADSCPPEKLGASFGLHRAMDTMGAVIGPMLAFLLLSILGWRINWIFFAAAVPAGLGLLVILGAVKEVPPKRTSDETFRFSLRDTSPEFRRFVLVSGIFSLGHFPAVFLILRCRELGIDMERVTLVYLLYNVVYSLVALPAGGLSDRVGRRRMLIASYLFFAAAFAGGALASEWWQGVVVFMAYGVFQGIYGGGHRAFIADLEPSERRASSYGVLHSVTGLMALPAGVVAGALWKFLGPAASFFLASAIGALSAILFAALIPAGNEGGRRPGR